jgi:protein-disulfide isomerase
MPPLHGSVTLAIAVASVDHVIGPEHARTTVVQYGDYECPICAGAEPAVRQLLKRYAQRIRFVFRHFPIEDAHPHALMAAEAAEAAAAQGRFWDLHEMLLANSTRLTRHHLDRYAETLGLDLARFKADLDDEVYRQRVREHQDGGRRSHIRATPAFFVNGVAQDVSGGMRDLFDAVEAEVKGR